MSLDETSGSANLAFRETGAGPELDPAQLAGLATGRVRVQHGPDVERRGMDCSSLSTHGGSGPPQPRLLAEARGVRLSDVVCGLGPRDGVFPEVHERACVAVVREGGFVYRTSTGS